MDVVSFAISPCPNDVTIFGALLLGRVALPEARVEFVFEDVETLNEAALAGAYDVVKVSAAMAAPLAEAYAVLPAGAAFGFGAGPKLVVAKGFAGRPRSVAVPGLRTTAATLLRAALAEDAPGLPPPDAAFVPVRYDGIVAAVQSGRAEAGLLIHETALAAASHGLELLLDLGVWWQRLMPRRRCPLASLWQKKAWVKRVWPPWAGCCAKVWPPPGPSRSWWPRWCGFLPGNATKPSSPPISGPMSAI